jgi:hypothetical protein
MYRSQETKGSIGFDVMRENTFNPVRIEGAIDKALEYSEDTEALRDFLDMNQDSISVRVLGVIGAPWDDKGKLKSLHYKVDFKGYMFDFYGSHNDAMQWIGQYQQSPYQRYSIDELIACEKKATQDKCKNRKLIVQDFLYSLLASISSDYHILYTLDDFCDSLGYDIEHKNTESIWSKCTQHAIALQQLLSDECIQGFPR